MGPCSRSALRFSWSSDPTFLVYCSADRELIRVFSTAVLVQGYGFVTFSRKEDAARAVQTLNGRELAAQPGKPLQVSFKRTTNF